MDARGGTIGPVMLAVDARDLTKTFRAGWLHRRRTEALRGVSLQVPRGERSQL